jgi:NAD(P)-dependent dehydrogenase (short-subunit alcohol dehydrogenase family)
MDSTLKKEIRMKNIVITGSTRGIGLAMAKEFLKANCHVTLSGRGENLADKVLNELDAYKDRFIYLPCNVQRREELQKLWDLSLTKWGTIDIWINNAGQNAPHLLIQDTEENYVKEVIATNLTGMIYGTQVAVKGMLKQKSGAIYGMEGLGSNNMIQAKTILYGTTKHALTYYMKGLAKELEGTGIIAGRLSPGMMLTDFITKTPDGEAAAIHSDERFKRIFNILADKPETVAAFFIPRMLANTKNDAHIVWLSSMKAGFRFITSPFHKRKLI